MVRFVSALRGSWFRHTAWAVFLAGFIVLGCSKDAKNAEAAAAADNTQYKIGAPVADSAIAAIVQMSTGSDTLTTKEFRQRMELIFQRFPMVRDNPEQSRELRRNILEDFVMRFALYQEAKRLNIMPDTGRVNAQLSRIRGQYPTAEAFQQALAQENVTVDSLRSMIAEEVKLQMLQEKMLETAKTPTPAELETFRKEQAQQIRAQHILFTVTPSATEAQQEEVRKKAAAVLDSIQKGSEFAAMARRHSADASAAQGGDLDWFSHGQMVPPFERAAFALADSGDVTKEPVRTSFGYHIIRLTGKRNGEPMDTSAARQALLNVRRQEAVKKSVNGLRGQMTVRMNPQIVDTELNVFQDN